MALDPTLTDIAENGEPANLSSQKQPSSPSCDRRRSIAALTPLPLVPPNHYDHPFSSAAATDLLGPLFPFPRAGTRSKSAGSTLTCVCL